MLFMLISVCKLGDNDLCDRFGWLGFNGGSTFAANLKAGMAITGTNLAACFGGLTWMLLDWRHFYRWSVVGFCTGAISGLVAITPAAGFVGIPAAALIGVVAAAVSNWLTRLKIWFNFDDTRKSLQLLQIIMSSLTLLFSVDIFSCHGISGIVGLLMTGIFCQSSVTANDGYAAIGESSLFRDNDTAVGLHAINYEQPAAGSTETGSNSPTNSLGLFSLLPGPP